MVVAAAGGGCWGMVVGAWWLVGWFLFSFFVVDLFLIIARAVADDPGYAGSYCACRGRTSVLNDAHVFKQNSTLLDRIGKGFINMNMLPPGIGGR